MKLITASILLGSAMALVACGPVERGTGDDTGGGGGGGGGDDDGTGGGGGGGGGGGTVQQCNKMDIVFVVDDSGSMAQEQSNLASNFPMFATVLQNYVNADGEHIDFRIAITTTGKHEVDTITLPPPFSTTQTITEDGPDGAFMKNCNVADGWLDNNTPNLGTALGCRANVGTGGASTEMPLLMAKHALSERVSDGKNAGFIRPDALLGVVMITDEDDSSSSQSTWSEDISGGTTFMIDWQPADEVSFFDGLKGNRSRWAAGVISGGTAACSSSGFGDATASPRMMDFVNQANANGTQQAVFSSICAGNLTQSLNDIVGKFQSACGGIIL